MGERLVISGVRVVDGTGLPPVADACMVVDGGVIAWVGPIAERPRDDSGMLLEYPGATVIPGLIDAHCHFNGVRSLDPAEMVLAAPELRGIRSVLDAWRLVDSGFTTVRDCGGSGHTTFLRAAIEEGSAVGPRVLSCGKVLTITGGHGDPARSVPLEWLKARHFSRIADGVDDCRRAVREQAREGADFIKVMASGGVLSEGDSPQLAQFSRSEMETIVEEAHALGLRVACHAHGERAALSSVAAGTDSLEHGTSLLGDTIALMLEKGTALVPTLSILDVLLRRGEAAGLSEELRKKAIAASATHRESFLRAWGAGVLVGLGTDFFLTPHVSGDVMGSHAAELTAYVEAGLSPMQAIVCATRNNARILGVEEEVGTLEPGRQADFVVVEGEPDVDVSLLSDRNRLLAVYKGGVPVPRFAY